VLFVAIFTQSLVAAVMPRRLTASRRRLCGRKTVAYGLPLNEQMSHSSLREVSLGERFEPFDRVAPKFAAGTACLNASRKRGQVQIISSWKSLTGPVPVPSRFFRFRGRLARDFTEKVLR